VIQISDNRDTITIQITGRFGFQLIKDFQQLLTRDPRMWIVDLATVDHIDSSALGMLMLLRERARGDRQRVVLRGVRGQPRDVLLMARFDRLFKLE
jgi:anti-anti-sigma factor